MTTTAPRTVRVRVAVAVSAYGFLTTSAVVGYGPDEAQQRLWADDVEAQGDIVVEHEVDIPLPPSPEAVAGEVAPAPTRRKCRVGEHRVWIGREKFIVLGRLGLRPGRGWAYLVETQDGPREATRPACYRRLRWEPQP